MEVPVIYYLYGDMKRLIEDLRENVLASLHMYVYTSDHSILSCHVFLSGVRGQLVLVLVQLSSQ